MRRRIDPRIRTLESAVARFEAHCAALSSAPAAGPVIGIAPSRLVENAVSSVVHRLRTAGVVTLCGWRCAKDGSCVDDALLIGEDELPNRPWWLLCERCLGTERELSRLNAVDAELCLSE